MINNKTAEKMAIKFFRAYGHRGLADDVEAGYCVNEIFRRAVKHLGKRGVFILYHELPPQLKTYFVIELSGNNNGRLYDRICTVDNKYEEIEFSERPERLKRFPEYFAKKQKVLFSYLKTKR